MHIAQNCYVCLAYTPVDLDAGATTGIRVDCRDYAHATFIGCSNDVNAVNTYTFQKHTAISAGTTATFSQQFSTTAGDSNIWIKQDTTNALLLSTAAWTRTAGAATLGTFSTTSGSACMIMVEFDLDTLGITGSTPYRWISVNITDPGAASIGFGIWLLSNARYAQDALSVTLP